MFALNADAEPWLASRFSTNCAACHAPGRVNVEARERRCTLSCQGCHTNPNGGGLRNAYGKWNQERWLWSGYVQNYRLNKPRPDVTDEQAYGPNKLKDFLGPRSDPKLVKRAITDGFRLKETGRMLPESSYDRRSTGETVFAESLDMAHVRIPSGDPWRERRSSLFNAGFDHRYVYLDKSRAGVKTKATFPMSTDIGVSAEPFHRVNMVFESRFLDGPTREGWDEGFTTSSQVRSAYVMVDDLPFNSYFMYGLYRPMMGHYNPDHTSLFAYATGLNQRSYFKAATVGTAPNVPFLNLHYIQPLGDTSSQTKSQDQGFAVNLGARFVTLGLFGTATYWSTTADYRAAAGNIVDTKYTSFTGGFTAWRWTLVADYTTTIKDQKNIRKDKGTVMTLENRLRAWHENYVLFNYETLNTNLSLQEGSAKQLTFGVSSFPVASVELSLVFKRLSETSNNTPTDTKMTLAQMHLFF